jgi:uncharacterized protein involved in response to NO
MNSISRNFFKLALLFAVAGMLLGLSMAISQNHSQMPVHAHIMVAGFLMSAVFGFFYHLFPMASGHKLATAHFWIHAVSLICLTVSLYFVLAGNPGVEPVTAVSSIVFFAGTLLFAWIAWPVLKAS